MLKFNLINFLLLLCTLLLISCQNENEAVLPKYSDITLTPAQAVYHVGDTIECSIKQLAEGGDNLLDTNYWWYASWWFANPDLKADFKEFNNNVCKSSKIVLTATGEVKLYFFGQLKYPEWNWIKVEIPIIITVKE